MFLSRFKCWCVVLLLSGSMAWVHAGNMKLGYVNAERVYSESRAAKRIELTLQKEFASQQQQLNQLKEQGVKLEQQLASNNLKATDRRALEQKWQEFNNQYRLASSRLEEEYSLRRNEEFAALQTQATDLISHFAEQEKYDLIVQEAVFVNRNYDITDRIIKLLDAQQ